MNSILEEDIKNIADSKLVNWEEFNNKSILITGATGLICSIMIKAFCKKKLNLKMYLLVRNKENAKQMYGENENIEYIESSIENFNVEEYSSTSTLNKIFFCGKTSGNFKYSCIRNKKHIRICKKYRNKINGIFIFYGNVWNYE